MYIQPHGRNAVSNTAAAAAIAVSTAAIVLTVVVSQRRADVLDIAYIYVCDLCLRLPNRQFVLIRQIQRCKACQREERRNGQHILCLPRRGLGGLHARRTGRCYSRVGCRRCDRRSEGESRCCCHGGLAGCHAAAWSSRRYRGGMVRLIRRSGGATGRASRGSPRGRLRGRRSGWG